MIFRVAQRNNLRFLISRCYSEQVGRSHGPSPSTASTTVKTDVPGLSSAVIHPASQPVGPGVDPNKSGAYKVPEYFCYDNMSFFEAEIEMAKFRLPQPSALKK
ncbi:unnamed protein product [Diatraea saccharalis]|uniref:NADH dehydrogenase [ubiquinone] flavoprotein 3, mitochondrial n=1 Tax=Diatraea saccharalis TaxID=40085 RepID=A0A9N9R2W1_9NEOP|nr:unnamed protein product [Diatraea saccharalis]